LLNAFYGMGQLSGTSLAERITHPPRNRKHEKCFSVFRFAIFFDVDYTLFEAQTKREKRH